MKGWSRGLAAAAGMRAACTSAKHVRSRWLIRAGVVARHNAEAVETVTAAEAGIVTVAAVVVGITTTTISSRSSEQQHLASSSKKQEASVQAARRFKRTSAAENRNYSRCSSPFLLHRL